MKEGSLIIFEQVTSGVEMCKRQKELFPEVVSIDAGTSGLICKIQKDDLMDMLLADVLIGSAVVCDIDLTRVEFSTLN